MGHPAPSSQRRRVVPASSGPPHNRIVPVSPNGALAKRLAGSLGILHTWLEGLPPADEHWRLLFKLFSGAELQYHIDPFYDERNIRYSRGQTSDRPSALQFQVVGTEHQIQRVMDELATTRRFSAGSRVFSNQEVEWRPGIRFDFRRTDDDFRLAQDNWSRQNNRS